MPNDPDVLIIGGGPAGLSAALWCAELGLDHLVLEREDQCGGQLLWTYNRISNYLGAEAENGRELRDRFLGQLGTIADRIRTGIQIITADLAARTLVTPDGQSFSSRYIVIATGVRRRRLGVPGEHELSGKGILSSGVKDPHAVSGRRVVVVGGGDAAVENALILSRYARSLLLVHRRGTFTARRQFVDELASAGNVQIAMNTVVTAFGGDHSLNIVELLNQATGRAWSEPVDSALIRIGVEPNSEPFATHLETDSSGYIRIDSRTATSVDRIYAIGDVTNTATLTIANAVGQGSTTARAILDNLSYNR